LTTQFVLKHNDAFAIVDPAGNMHARNEIDHDIADGLICRDTRLLSRNTLTVNGQPADAVNTMLSKDNTVFETRLKTPDENLELWRTLFVWQDHLYEEIALVNRTADAQEIALAYDFAADFQDLFELRGAKRKSNGTQSPTENTDNGLHFAYTGLDQKTRDTFIAFSKPAQKDADGKTVFTLTADAGSSLCLYSRIGPDDIAGLDAKTFENAKADAGAYVQEQLNRRAEIESSNPEFDIWVHQNAVDIALLTTKTDQGPYPYAGIPWYSAAFGRDALITGFQTLWQDPDLSKGILGYLAHHQATETDTFHDSEPGKIMHELRLGEMAACGEIPHTPYYGTADATPLFVFLAGAYLERTGDIAFIKTLWPHIERALDWIDNHGDKDGDGFVEYLRGAESGLGNQGWKDSQDSISHADGTLAEGAIALCEVQGYVYAAKKAAGDMARSLKLTTKADALYKQAKDLKEKFNQVFWSDDLGTYALALDGHKKPCLVSSSNTGHLLFSGIVPDDRAAQVADRLMADDMFTGYGIRTLSANEKRYEPVKNPEGYHNGTVWTHDTAICAAGMARYGMEDKASKLLSALFDAARHFPQQRLPELFGGLARDTQNNTPPAPYPVACNPQAWASASESLLVQSMLGLKIDGHKKQVTIENPRLPAWLTELTLHGLQIGDGSISLRFQRHDEGVDITHIGGSPDIDLHIIRDPDNVVPMPKKHNAM